MKIIILVGSSIIAVAVLVVGYFLYQQSERHFAESQRWLSVCIKQVETELERDLPRVLGDESLPEEVRESAKRGIKAWDQDYLYSRCYKEWHAGG
jgi:hypothetical protein